MKDRPMTTRIIETGGVPTELKGCWLVGLRRIGAYMGVSQTTVWRWKRDGVPIARMPGGSYAATPWALDAWMVDRMKAQNAAESCPDNDISGS